MYSLKTLFVRTIVGLILSAGFTYGVFRVFGAAFAGLSLIVTLLILVPLLIRALELGSFASKSQALSHVNGAAYICHGVSVAVAENLTGQRWVELAAFRRSTGSTTADAVFAGIYPAGYASIDGKGYLREDVLRAHLKESQELHAIKFKVWLQRTLAPSIARERMGAGDALLP